MKTKVPYQKCSLKEFNIYLKRSQYEMFDFFVDFRKPSVFSKLPTSSV